MCYTRHCKVWEISGRKTVKISKIKEKQGKH